MPGRRYGSVAVGVVLVLGFAFVLGTWPGPTGASHGGLDAALYQGTCDDLAAEPVVELEPLGYTRPVLGTPVGTPPSHVSVAGIQEAVPAVTSSTLVDVPFDRLLAEPHAILVTIVGGQDGEPVRLACGNVGGVPAGVDLAFGIEPLAAETAGIAWLRALDGQTRVTLFVTQGLVDGEAGTPTTEGSSHSRVASQK